MSVRSEKISEALGRGRNSSSSQVFFNDSSFTAGRGAQAQLGGDHPGFAIGQFAVDVGRQVGPFLGVQSLLGPNRHTDLPFVTSSCRGGST